MAQGRRRIPFGPLEAGCQNTAPVALVSFQAERRCSRAPRIRREHFLSRCTASSATQLVGVFAIAGWYGPHPR